MFRLATMHTVTDRWTDDSIMPVASLLLAAVRSAKKVQFFGPPRTKEQLCRCSVYWGVVSLGSVRVVSCVLLLLLFLT